MKKSDTDWHPFAFKADYDRMAERDPPSYTYEEIQDKNLTKLLQKFDYTPYIISHIKRTVLMTITQVIPGSPAQADGFLDGDEVYDLDGITYHPAVED